MAKNERPTPETSHEPRAPKWWDTSIDPIGVSLVAAQLDPEACLQKSGKIKRSDARKAARQTLIRAIQLIQEAQDIIKNGPNPEDVPSEYWAQHSNEEFDKFKQDCEGTFHLSTPGKRLKAVQGS